MREPQGVLLPLFLCAAPRSASQERDEGTAQAASLKASVVSLTSENEQLAARLKEMQDPREVRFAGKVGCQRQGGRVGGVG